MGTPALVSQSPSMTIAAAVATPARSRGAVRRPLAMAMAPRPASDDGDHGEA